MLTTVCTSPAPPWTPDLPDQAPDCVRVAPTSGLGALVEPHRQEPGSELEGLVRGQPARACPLPVRLRFTLCVKHTGY